MNNEMFSDSPFPDIHALFVYYRDLYFQGRLGGVSVEWSSKRMTSCGGTTQKVPGGAKIKLSQPLLILRPSEDLKMVLLHEMIHAHCMVEGVRDADPGGHGAPFQSIMHQINSSTVADPERPHGGYNITVYHTMTAEVDYYKQHHWRCERCGIEWRRANNRAPQEADCFQRPADPHCQDRRCKWHMHLQTCGADKIKKVKEPEGYVRKKKNVDGGGGGEGSSKRVKTGNVEHKQPDISKWFTGKGNVLSRGGNNNNNDDDINDGTLSAISAVLQGAATAAGNSSLPPSSSAVPVTTATEEISAEARRSLFAAAALKRFGGGGGGTAAASRLNELKQEPQIAQPEQQQHQQQSPEVIDLVDDATQEDGDSVGAC